MRIAVCDDNREELLRVLEQLALYQEVRQTELYCRGFQGAAELLDALEREEFDVLLLDVLMPGLNGLQAARELRQRNETIKIVFLTSTPEFAVESYSVQASNYLLKPAARERLFPILDGLRRELQRPEDALAFHVQGCVFRLPYGRIESVEVMSKILYFHMADGSTREIHGNLSEYESALLSRPGFVKVHRSYLVNFRWVTEVRQTELLTAQGRRVPIARAAYPQVRTAYLDYLFQAGLEEGGGRTP